ncbi:ferritin-like domain-containing protein [Dyadobacter fanqingshengii]|uniref:Ferritin-like domain-containing protein n=1 Tax=Dyadobacter fanqingshengii TaxID=2906443 RepID=A0A9X1T941_9BACT|nr:ferritin-like domain-containing protein [Dyadobacter fanqingshengii]MCF0040203.1 ferritin-like domain-containing protein [Dyadobacter fanqingshengii]MCF2502309.1 ferritin-like domain-containing protein [Dyadobacter fanqingshengii]USJ38048.1 ferritin-like domain-containing protein [Dyadobacter fanqingshengii]
MNIFRILDSIQQVDGDAAGRIAHTTRRMFMNRIGSTLATAAVPTAFAAVVNKAYGATPSVTDILNFALTLEYLEETFYFQANRMTNFIPAEYTLVFSQIERHETQHVEFLKAALGSAAVDRPQFDFTYGGAFPDAWTNFMTFITISAALEDTGVRAYKGQAGNLIGSPQILEYALQVHSVEARHASLVRRIIGHLKKDPMMKGWITQDKGFPEAVYKGMTPESNTVHAGLDAATLSGIGSISRDNVTEAFDEPLTMEEVLAIAGPFIKKMGM